MIGALHALLESRLARFALGAAELLARDAPQGLGSPGSASANGQCRLLACKDGWGALNLAREDDRAAMPALTGQEGDAWDSAARFAAHIDAAEFRARAVELHLPVALPGEAKALPLAGLHGPHVPRLVMDLSALWAGPLCAALLARAGAQVVRIDSAGRPDPTAQGSPRLHALLDADKRAVRLDLRGAEGRAALHALLDGADALVTSARPAALARLGLTPARFPHLRWAAITAHGFTGAAAQRVGFGDDCAVAGGLLRWQGGLPRFLGDALADPLTGLEAALAVLECAGPGLIDLPMARIAAAYAAQLA